ncbi:MAG: hypothetical protein ACAI25_12750 [Planctomycetota bacterium]
MDRKSLALGVGVFLALAASSFVLRCGGKSPGPPATSPAVPVAIPADAAPLGSHTPPLQIRVAGTREAWEHRLARQDEILVQQVLATGCDAERVAKLRELLIARQAHRVKTIAAHRAREISDDEMHAAAYEAQVAFDEGLKRVLTPDELEALDPVAARTQVLAEEVTPR